MYVNGTNAAPSFHGFPSTVLRERERDERHNVEVPLTTSVQPPGTKCSYMYLTTWRWDCPGTYIYVTSYC